MGKNKKKMNIFLLFSKGIEKKVRCAHPRAQKIFVEDSKSLKVNMNGTIDDLKLLP